MAELGEILYQHRQGFSLRKIAQSLAVSRNTVKSVIKKAKQVGYQGVNTSVTDIEDIVCRICAKDSQSKSSHNRCVQPIFTRLHTVIETHLHQPYMTVRQCLRLLKEQHGIDASETSLHRYIKAHIQLPEATVIPLPTTPGQQAQVDYGYVGLLICPTMKKQRKAYAFIMTLSHSRYRFVYFVFRQDQQTWCDCHRRAFEFFGGVPKTVVLDNLKAGVIKPDFYDPTLNRVYAECEKHYGFVADPAKVRLAKHKGKVERSVTLVKQQVIAGREFSDILAANAYGERWCREDIAKKMTRTTGETPIIRFNRDDKPALLALPEIAFDPPHWQAATVQKDSHITFSGSFYSVPPGYLKQRVWVRADARLVNIYSDSNQLVKRHPRATHKGQWCTDWLDLPKDRRDYVLQTAEQLLSLAKHMGPQIHTMVEKIIDGTLTETRKRKVNALLRLAESYGQSRLEAACLRALVFGNTKLKAIKRILERQLDVEPLVASDTSAPVSTEGCFLHDSKDFYSH